METDCSLWGTNWTFVHTLDEFRASRAVPRSVPGLSLRGSIPGHLMWGFWWTKWHSDFSVFPCQYHCSIAAHSSSYILYVTLTISTNRGNLGTFPKKKINALLENGCESNREVLSLHAVFSKTKISILQQCLHFVRHVFHIFLIIHLLSQTLLQPPSGNQPTVRMQSLYVSVATPLYVLCISIVLDKHGGDA